MTAELDASRYDALFERDGLRVSRSPWGPDDEIGRLNWMTEERRSEALAGADLSRPYDLAVEYFLGMPCWVEAGDPEFQIWMTHTPAGTVNDDATGAGAAVHERFSYSGSAISLYSHTGTHVCGLTHIGYHGTFWNGRVAKDDLGSRAWTRGASYPPIVGRGVLLDIAAVRDCDCLPESYAITPDDIDEGYRLGAIEARAGDIVMLRTGQMSNWPDRERFLARPPGLDMDAARMLCEELAVMTVGLDVGGEALPSAAGTFLSVHAYLAATAGAMLIENMWLEDLSRERVYEVGVVAAPMKLRGSSGAPVRPLAFPRSSSPIDERP